MILYASLKNQNKLADFVILDECHALTPKRILYLRQILQKGTRIIFLSATIPDEKKALMDNLCKNVHYDAIPLTRAFKIGLLPVPKLVVHKLYLNTAIVNGKKWEFVSRKPKKGSTEYVYTSHELMYDTLKKTPKN